MPRDRRFLIDLEAECLRHGADTLSLRPKTWAVLRLLVERTGKLVTKQQLLDTVWRDAVVEEKTLNASISEIRHALGDSARQPRFVETEHGRGFRFVASLSSWHAAAGPTVEPRVAAKRRGVERAPFVGRDAEFSHLRTALVELRDGCGGICLIAGAAGVGKSRLVGELLASSEGREHTVLVGRCLEGGDVPYWPWIEMIRCHMRTADPEGLLAGGAISDLACLVPALGTGETGRILVSDSDPDLARLRLFDAIGRFLEGIAVAQPPILVIEDLHWADVASLRVLQALAARVAVLPALVILTMRDEAADTNARVVDMLATLERDDRFTTLRLGGLPESPARELVAELVRSPIPPAVVGQIVEVSEGNPFFIEQTLRHLTEQAPLGSAAAWWSRFSAGQLDPPASVALVFERRVRRLSKTCRHLLDAAAVIGVESDEDVLACTLGVEAEALAAPLGEAIAAGVLHELPDRPGVYRFGHTLMRLALYDLQSAPMRRRRHKAVAEAIELLRDVREALPDLAYHLCQAVPTVPAERAIDVALLAAQRAEAQLAYESQAEQYRRAWSLARASNVPGVRRRCAELAVRRAETLQKAGDGVAASVAFREAVRDARESDTPVWLARAALGMSTLWELDAPDVQSHIEEALAGIGDTDLRLRTRLLARLAVVLYPLPDSRKRCEQLCEEALANARRIGESRLLGQTLSDLLAGQWYPYNLAAQAEVCEELTSVAGVSGDRELLASALGWQVVVALGGGNIGLARRQVATLVDLAAELRQPTHQWCGTYLSATIKLLLGDLEEAERRSVQAFAIGETCSPNAARRIHAAQILTIRREQNRLGELLPALQRPDHPHADILMWTLPHFLVEADRPHEAHEAYVRALARGIDAMPGDNSRNLRLMTLGAMAHACAALRETQTAAELYARIAPHVERWSVAGWGNVCYGLMANGAGALATCLRRWSEAEHHFQFAIAEYERVGAEVALARSLHLYAEMLIERDRDRSDRDRALSVIGLGEKVCGAHGLKRVALLLQRLRERTA